MTQLDSSHALTTIYASASDGNLVQTVQVNLAHGGATTLALGFGTTKAGAVSATEGSLATPFGQIQQSYEAGWDSYDAGLIAPPARFGSMSAAQFKPLVDEYYLIRERHQSIGR